MFTNEEKLKVLKGYKNELWDKVLSYSANYLMSEPKPRCEKEWEEAQNKALCIEELIKELGGGK